MRPRLEHARVDAWLVRLLATSLGQVQARHRRFLATMGAG